MPLRVCGPRATGISGEGLQSIGDPHWVIGHPVISMEEQQRDTARHTTSSCASPKGEGWTVTCSLNNGEMRNREVRYFA